MSVVLLSPTIRKKTKWQAFKTYVYYKWYYYVWYYVKLYYKVAHMFLFSERELYYVYDLNIHQPNGTITKLYELTWRNYRERMSVDFGEYALLKFPNQDGQLTLVTSEYFGHRKVKHGRNSQSILKRAN